MACVRRLLMILLVCGWFIAADPAFAQCPMCKTGLVSSPEGQQMADGFNKGILFLFSVPFVLTGIISLLILKAQRRKRLTISNLESQIENPTDCDQSVSIAPIPVQQIEAR